LCAIKFVIYLNRIVDRNIHCRKEQISEYRLKLLLMFHKKSEEEKNLFATKVVARCLINFQAFIVQLKAFLYSLFKTDTLNA
jgi:hypothetical protein